MLLRIKKLLCAINLHSWFVFDRFHVYDENKSVHFSYLTFEEKVCLWCGKYVNGNAQADKLLAEIEAREQERKSLAQSLRDKALLQDFYAASKDGAEKGKVKK